MKKTTSDSQACKQLILFRCLIGIFLLSPSWNEPVYSQDTTAAPIAIVDAVIAIGVENLIPVSPGITFDATIGSLYCFTRIKTSLDPAVIKHLWFHGDKIVMETTLPIKSSNWRTYSMKTILPSDIGEWKVDVTSEDGTILKTLNFTIR